MPKLRNVVTGVVKELPARYIGLYPYELVVEAHVAKNLEGYKPAAEDGDGDGIVQDGTPFQREVGEELSPEEQEEAVVKASKKGNK